MTLTPFEIFCVVLFLVSSLLCVFGLAMVVCLIIGHSVNIVWLVLNRLFPKVFLTREQLGENMKKIEEFIKHDS